jgi:hypothetical protein
MTESTPSSDISPSSSPSGHYATPAEVLDFWLGDGVEKE